MGTINDGPVQEDGGIIDTYDEISAILLKFVIHREKRNIKIMII